MVPSFARERSGEREAEMRGEYWGGCTRHNRIVRRAFGLDGQFLWEETVAENHAVMMYSPFLEGG